jgi:chromate transporter
MAAVFGVVLNLAVWFALHVNFETVSRRRFGPLEPWVPDLTTIQWVPAGLTALAVFVALRFRVSTWLLLLGGTLLGALAQAVSAAAG